MNYEALGIYTEAEENYRHTRRKRADKASEIIRELRRAVDNNGTNAIKLDIQKLELDLKELKTLNEEMTGWIGRANSVHDECGKQKIDFSSF